MKIFVKSKNGKMLKIGNTAETAKWYFMTDEVIAFVTGKFNVGDEVEFQSSQSAEGETINRITKKGGDVPVASNGSNVGGGTGFQKKPFVPKEQWIAEQKAKQAQSSGGEFKKSTYGKSPEEQDSIKRQAIGHMTSRTLIAMQGIVTPDNVESLVEKIYNKYVEVVG